MVANGISNDDVETGIVAYGSFHPERSTESTENECMDSNQQQHNGFHPAHNEHLQKTRQYYRDMMLGVNDGLVSTLLLVAGVVGGGMSVSDVLLTAISGAIAGASKYVLCSDLKILHVREVLTYS